ncbi:MAG: carboxypeptidase regulatory-like domain-containing protein [Pseudomonadota bacterium]
MLRPVSALIFLLASAAACLSHAADGEWLLANIGPSGSVDAARVAAATPYQATAETLATLTILGETASPKIPLARSHVLAEPFRNTENLSRQIVAGVAGGDNVLSRIEDLIASQHPKDGGFGEFAGWQSTPLDTAFALTALAAAGKANDRSVGSAVTYLSNTQQADGSWGSDSTESPVYVTALALHGLHQVRNSRNVSLQIEAARDWLLAQRGSNGLWQDAALSGQVLSALIPTYTDAVPLRPALEALTAQRAADGSFSNDAWDTAWALRALFLGRQLRTNPDEIVIRGRVLDGDSLLPLAGVSVALTGAQSGTLTTTADGSFAFRNLLAGNYTATLSRAGFGTLTATMSAVRGSYLDLGDVKMLRDTATATTGALRGVVTDAGNGQPVAGATVSIEGGASVTTAADGSYQLNDVLPGSVQLRVSAAGYRAATDDAAITAGTFVVYSPVLVRVELPDPDATAVSGKVIDDATGTALAGVTITLQGPQTYSATTAANGLFAVTAMVEGSYTLTATAAGYSDVTATVQVPLGVVVALGTLRLSAPDTGATTGSVRGVVTDALNGVALAGANVNIPGFDVVTTGADGSYLIENVPAGAIQLNAFANGYRTVTADGTVVAGSTLYFSPRMELVNDPLTVSMQGTVTSAVTGAPVADAFMFVYQPNYRWNWTDARGRYVLDGIQPGHVLIKVSANGFDDIFMGFQASSGTTIAFSPKMYATGTSPADASSSSLAGRVVSAASGDVIAGAQVRLQWVDLDGTDTAHDVVQTVGADGVFRQTGIRAFDVSIEITAAGFDPYITTMKLPALLATDMGDIRLHPTDVVALVPDLTVTALDMSAVSSDPQTLAVSGHVTVTVQNNGTADAGPFTVLVDGGTPAGTAWSAPVAALAIGESAPLVIAVNGVLPFRDAPLRALADSEGVVIESDKTNNVRYSCDDCRAAPLAASSRQVKQKWWWDDAAVITVPLVGPLLDTNGDGKVDRHDRTAVVFVAYTGSPDGGRAFIRALWGDDGSLIWQNMTNAASTEASQTPAMGDIDGDGKPEIVYFRYGGGVVALNNTGTIKWTSSSPAYPGRYTYQHMSLADLDGDGKSEVIARNTVLNHDGTLRTVLPAPFEPEHHTMVVDITGDGRPEILIGHRAFRADGTLLWQYSRFMSALAVGDFTGDGQPEIVMSHPSSPGILALVSATGQRIWQVNMSQGGGAPVVFDANGDGVPEIGVATGSNFRVYRADGSLLWSKSTSDVSLRTSASAFDIQGDKRPEVFYGDDAFLRIFDGMTGAELVKIANVSATALEYPVVADIDDDGHTEFLFVGTHLVSNGRGLHAWEGLNDDWLPTRKVWNQYLYHVDNVGDDLQIPATEVPSWQTHKTFRQSLMIDRDPLESANLTVGHLRALDAGVGQPLSLLARVGNAGLLDARAGGTVRFYAGTPDTGTLLGTQTLPALAPDQSMDVRLDNVTGLSSGALITVVVVPKAGELDCRTGDDRHAWQLTVSDQQGDVTVATDASAYGPEDDVAITVTAHNTGALGASFSVAVRIVDVNGVVVAELPVENLPALSGDATATIERLWNTGDILVGDYEVVTELYAADGTLITEARAGFRINPADGVELADMSVATDKPSYSTTDTVGIEGLARNLSTNMLLAGASIAVEMRTAGGTPAGEWSDTAADLPAGAGRTYEVALPLTAAAQGDYTVRAVLRSATGAELASAEATFTVQEVLSRSLTGELQRALAALYVGQTQECTGMVGAAGTQGISDLPVRLAAVPLSGGSAVVTLAAQTVTLPAGGNQAIAASFGTSDQIPGDYACALQYQDNGNWQTLAWQPFVLQVPPVILGGSVGASHADVQQGDPQVCTFTVTNSGGGTAQNLVIERSLLDAGGAVVAQQSSTVALAGNASQSFVQSYNTQGLPEGGYRCLLETIWNNQRVTHGEAAWNLLPRACPVPEPVPSAVDLRDDRDLIVNGSFEEYGRLNQGIWGTFASIPGWEAKYGPLEIQTTAIDGIVQKHGSARLELDSNNNSEISQWVATDIDGHYELLLWYSPRIASAGTNTNDVEIWWDGRRVQTLGGDVQGWREVRIELVADKGLTELKLKAAGRSDKLGGLVDQVRLYCIACRRANLVNNGSFERHPRFAGEASDYFTAIPGWRAVSGEPFEVQHDSDHQVNVLDGHAQLQPDARANAGAMQDIPTRAGRQYGLDLFYAADVPVNAAGNPVEIWWEGQKIDTVQQTRTGWYMKRYRVTAGDGSSRLEFRGAGTSDGRGGVIDNVQLGCAMPATPNLIVNGSFESHPVLPYGLWGTFTAIAGWTAETAVPFEIQEQGFIRGFSCAHGNALLELDANANSGAYQDVVTEAGRGYTLRFQYSPRLIPLFTDSSNVEVWWGSERIATLSGQVPGWKEYAFRVTATTATTRLTFRAAGRSDSFGGLIDNVQLTAADVLPRIVSAPLTDAMTGEPWQYVPDVADAPDGYSLMLEQAPTGMTLDADGMLRWGNPVRGEYPVRIRVDDGCGGSSVQAFTLTVGWPAWCPLP